MYLAISSNVNTATKTGESEAAPARYLYVRIEDWALLAESYKGK